MGHAVYRVNNVSYSDSKRKQAVTNTTFTTKNNVQKLAEKGSGNVSVPNNKQERNRSDRQRPK